MSNPKRTQADIRTIVIDTNPPGYNGWLVSLRYWDDKMAQFQADHGKPDTDMLQLVADAIKKQLEGTNV